MSNIKKLDISVVLPSYREAENLQLLLPRISKALDSLGLLSEIIVVDTIRQLDNTEEVCFLYGAKYILRKKDNSFGSAVRTGINCAQGNFTIFMDADGSHSPEFIPTLYDFAKDYDVVIASRYIKDGDTENPFVLIVMSKILNWIFSRVLGLNCKDVSNSFKIYRTSQLKLLNLKCNNFDIVEEILYKLKINNKNIKFREVPYFFKKRIFGKTKRNLFLFVLTYAYTIMKLRFRS